MGDQRLRARLRRLPAARRARGRPARPPPDLPRRPRRLHGRLAARRLRLVRGVADRARALQGLGAAIISPAALSILSTTFREGRERNIALGVWGAVGGFGAAAGVLLGGILTDALCWEWIFFVNVPVGVAALALTPRAARREPRRARPPLRRAGAVLVTGGLSRCSSTRSRRPTAGGWLARDDRRLRRVALALLAGFVVWEPRHPEPLMRFGILRTRPCSARTSPASSWARRCSRCS